MSSTAPRLTLALLGVLLVPRLLSADTIYRRNGNIIEVDSWRRSGDFIEYYQFGGQVSIRSSEVLRIEREGSSAPEAVAPAAPATGEAAKAVAPAAPKTGEAAKAVAPAAPATGETAKAAAPVTAANEEAANTQMLGRAFRALSAGDVDAFVSYFRYVDDPKWPDERPGLTRVFVLVRDRLGRPDVWEAARATSARTLNLSIESATPDEWRRSDCVFKGYTFKTALVEGTVRRPAEVSVEVCHARTAARSWLRKMDLRFLGQDPKVVQTLQEIAQAAPSPAAAKRP
jgi:hypothetical protein